MLKSCRFCWTAGEQPPWQCRAQGPAYRSNFQRDENTHSSVEGKIAVCIRNQPHAVHLRHYRGRYYESTPSTIRKARDQLPRVFTCIQTADDATPSSLCHRTGAYWTTLLRTAKGHRKCRRMRCHLRRMYTPAPVDRIARHGFWYFSRKWLCVLRRFDSGAH